MTGNETNRLVKGALWLSIAGLISKMLSAGYRIPLQNLTGDVGFYIYQQVYPILGIATILALYGFPSAISALTAKELSQGKRLTWQSFYAPILSILLVVHLILAGIIWMFAPMMAGIVNEASLVSVYRLISIVFLLVPGIALLRGVHQGTYQMMPTAISQVGEQLMRITVIIGAACLVAFSNFPVDIIGRAAVYASFLGGCAAGIILLIFFLRGKNKSSSLSEISHNHYPIKTYWKTLLIFGIAAAMNHMTLLLIQLADSFTFVPQLMQFGTSTLEAKELKGVFDRGQPLIQLVTVLGSSIALAIIPVISDEKRKTDKTKVYTYIGTAFVTGFYIVVGAIIGLFLLFLEINRLLFQNDQGTAELRILMFTIIFSTLAIIGSTVLQGFGYIKRTASFIAITFIIKLAGNSVFIPLYGMKGAAVATVLSLFFLFLFVMFEMNRKLPKLKIHLYIRWRSVFIASFILFIYVSAWQLLVPESFLASRLVLLLYVCVVSISGGLLYLIMLVRTSAFTDSQLKILPKSSLLLRLTKRGNK